MTRRKKTKSNASQNAASGVTPSPTAKATVGVVSKDNSIFTPTSLHPLPTHHTIHLSTTLRPAATASTPSSSVRSSVVNEVASTSSSENNDEATKNIQRKKKPVNTKVTYVTEQIHIYPRYPILTVERLRNIDYHINMLTESIGRRPRVYQHGKGVRFVPESNEEYRIIQRYLAKIESAERIAWCSYTVPTGNSLRVNVKVRKVEILKVTEDLQKLNLINGTNPTIAKAKDSSHKDIKTSTKNSTLQNVKLTTSDFPPKEAKLSTEDSSLQKDKLTPKDFVPKEAKLPTKDFSPITSNNGLKESKPMELVSKDLQLTATNIRHDIKKKKPRDIAQNRSYKRKTNH